MKILSLVENSCKSDLKAKHGLSIYIETKSHKILFDLGPDDTLFQNAEKRNIDISQIDTVIISHGHIDHGGALEKFLLLNSKAKVYVQSQAFEPHYSKTLFLKISVGIDPTLKFHPQIVLLDGDYKIDDELSLFTVKNTSKLYSPVNNALYDKNGKDLFLHEQNLIVADDKTVLLMGCGHAGVVNIMEKAEKFHPDFCIGGFHLFNPVTKKSVSNEFMSRIVAGLAKYNNTEFYTCHCTGEKAFNFLSRHMSNLHYLSCGDTIII